MSTEEINIKGIADQWEDVRRKLITEEIKYNDIEKLKREMFFNRFDNMFKDYNEFATIDLSKIKLLLRSVYENGHEVSRFTPTPKYRSLNRFNPEDRTFIYLGISMNEDSKNYDHVKNTCYKELRVFDKNDIECMSTLEFRVLEHLKNKKVLDFSKISKYKTSYDIKNEMVKYQEMLVYMYMNHFLINDLIKHRNSKRLALIPNTETFNIEPLESSKEIITEYMVKIYLKLINDSIFKEVDTNGLDKNTQNYIRKNEYAPFHVFASYIESMGFSGIIYNSTVCDGLNLVLFNVSDVEPVGKIKEENIKL